MMIKIRKGKFINDLFMLRLVDKGRKGKSTCRSTGWPRKNPPPKATASKTHISNIFKSIAMFKHSAES